jgi:acetyl-CoA synthetase
MANGETTTRQARPADPLVGAGLDRGQRAPSDADRARLAAQSAAEIERALGALYGAAIGGALGTVTRAAPPSRLRELAPELDGFVAGAPQELVGQGLPEHGLALPTEVALLVAELIAEGDGGDVARTLAARLGEREPALLRRWGGPIGAALLAVPLGICAAPDALPQLVDRVEAFCQVGHGDGRVIAGAAAAAAALAAGLNGATAREAVELALRAAQLGELRGHAGAGASVAERIAWSLQLAGRHDPAGAPQAVATVIGVGPHMHEVVPAALALVLLWPDDPWRVCVEAARLGGESDTIGALAGAIAGAMSGVAGFPVEAVGLIDRAAPRPLPALAGELVASRPCRAPVADGGADSQARHGAAADDRLIWQPAADCLQHSNVGRFMAAHDIPSYEELVKRSVGDVAWFWDAALRDLGVEWDRPYDQVLDESAGFAWARWFVGGKLNIVRNCLDRHAAGPRGEHAAIEWVSEGGEHVTVSYAELDAQVCRAANALKAAGIHKGDTIGLYVPMIPEMAVAFYAALKIGAVIIPIFSGFGAQALATRLQDAGCRLLVTADGSVRRGKAFAIKPEADRALESCPAVETVVVVDRLGAQRRAGAGLRVDMTPGRDVWWSDFLAAQPTSCPTESLDAEDRSLIIFTSGTTGRPKGTVHTHAGCLAQMAKELGYAFDLQPDDVFFWVTDIGWMMGPWQLIGVHFFGATVVLFEGAPNWPHAGRLWEMCSALRTTQLGISPTLIRLLMRESLDNVDRYDLSALRSLGSTGEPWDPDSYAWFFRHVGGGRIPIINMSGGTEIVGCFLMPLPITALKSTTLRGPGLGMAVDCVDDQGRSVREELGYLVCRRPAPSMTKGFLNDPGRYIETYFTRFGPDVWFHGDWAYVDGDGFWFLRGRADDTIKVSGRRTGPAEIESALTEHPAVSEAAAIGVPHEIKGEGVVCFCVVHSGVEESEELRAALKAQVVKVMGKTLRPDDVRFVDALPRTRSAKTVRGLIRRAFLGDDVGDLSSVENPLALDEIRQSR